MVLTTLFVTFVLIVGLALVVLYSVAGPPLRDRGSRFIAAVDDGVQRLDNRVRPALHRMRARLTEWVTAHRAAATSEDRETADLH